MGLNLAQNRSGGAVFPGPLAAGEEEDQRHDRESEDDGMDDDSTRDGDDQQDDGEDEKQGPRSYPDRTKLTLLPPG